jgi:hypothetical protein
MACSAEPARASTSTSVSPLPSSSGSSKMASNVSSVQPAGEALVNSARDPRIGSRGLHRRRTSCARSDKCLDAGGHCPTSFVVCAPAHLAAPTPPTPTAAVETEWRAPQRAGPAADPAAARAAASGRHSHVSLLLTCWRRLRASKRREGLSRPRKEFQVANTAQGTQKRRCRQQLGPARWRGPKQTRWLGAHKNAVARRPWRRRQGDWAAR